MSLPRRTLCGNESTRVIEDFLCCCATLPLSLPRDVFCCIWQTLCVGVDPIEWERPSLMITAGNDVKLSSSCITQDSLSSLSLDFLTFTDGVKEIDYAAKQGSYKWLRYDPNGSTHQEYENYNHLKTILFRVFNGYQTEYSENSRFFQAISFPRLLLNDKDMKKISDCLAQEIRNHFLNEKSERTYIYYNWCIQLRNLLTEDFVKKVIQKSVNLSLGSAQESMVSKRINPQGIFSHSTISVMEGEKKEASVLHP